MRPVGSRLITDAGRRARRAVARLVRPGFTDRCRKCELLRQRRSAAGSAHSEECRARFEAILREAEDPRVRRADARVTERLAVEVQAELTSVVESSDEVMDDVDAAVTIPTASSEATVPTSKLEETNGWFPTALGPVLVPLVGVAECGGHQHHHRPGIPN